MNEMEFGFTFNQFFQADAFMGCMLIQENKKLLILLFGDATNEFLIDLFNDSKGFKYVLVEFTIAQSGFKMRKRII